MIFGIILAGCVQLIYEDNYCFQYNLNINISILIICLFLTFDIIYIFIYNEISYDEKQNDYLLPCLLYMIMYMVYIFFVAIFYNNQTSFNQIPNIIIYTCFVRYIGWFISANILIGIFISLCLYKFIISVFQF